LSPTTCKKLNNYLPRMKPHRGAA